MGIKVSNGLGASVEYGSSSKLKISKGLRAAMERDSSSISKGLDDSFEKKASSSFGHDMNGFYIPTDLDLSSDATEKREQSNKVISDEIDKSDERHIQNYLDSISSGIKYYSDSERIVCEEGDTIVFSLDEVVDMVNNGYNIIEAKCLNERMIQVKYQAFMKRNRSKMF